MMKRLIMIMTAACSLLAASLLVSGCQYDDSDLWKEIENVKTQIDRLRSDVDKVQILVKQLSGNKGIVSVDESDSGYTITFTDKTSITINNGQDGADGSVIGVKEEQGISYWTVDGEFLLAGGNKVAVTGNDGHTPVLGIDAEGFWCVDGTRILSNEKPVPAQGDSFFKGIAAKDGKVTFTMADGSSFQVPMSTGAMLAFAQKLYFISDGFELPIQTAKLSFIALDEVPAGIKAELDEAHNTITLTITDAASFEDYSRLIIKGADENGYAMMASCMLRLPDTRKSDFLVLNEGWFGQEDGSVNVFYRGAWDLRAYAGANGGQTLGTTSTVAVQNGDCIYFVSKDGQHIVEAETSTLKKKSALEFGRAVQAMGFAAINAEKGYITTDDGVYELGLNPLSKGRKIFSGSCGDIEAVNGKIYFISKKNAYVYDPAAPQTSPVKIGAAEIGFVHSGDFIWAATANQLVKISATEDKIVENIPTEGKVRWNTWAWTPSPLSMSNDGKYIYYPSGDQIKRFDTAASSFVTLYSIASKMEYYGAQICMHPRTNELYLITTESGFGDHYLNTNIEVIDHETGKLIRTIDYTDVNNTYWFPSQVVFIR